MLHTGGVSWMRTMAIGQEPGVSLGPHTRREGGTLSCAPSAVADAGNERPLNWVSGGSGNGRPTPSAHTVAGRSIMPPKQSIRSPQVADPPPQTWSNCLVVGNQVFVAGMTARTGNDIPGGDSMYEQAKATLTKIKHLIEAAGGCMDDVVKVNIFVTNIRQREEVWRARREFFTGDFPVSTLVEVSALAAPELLVEIEAVAILGASGR